jgi:hypothetical protein
LGNPLSVQDYKTIYQEDKEAAITKLTEDMRVALRAQMVYVEEGNEVLTEKLLVLGRNNFTRNIFPMYSGNPAVCQAEQAIANHVTELDEAGKTALEVDVDAYQALLDSKGVKDYGVANKNKRSIFWVLIGFPFWLLGTIFGRIPHIVARNLRNKFVPFIEFSTSFAFTAALIMWILWGLLAIGISAFFIGWWSLLLPFVLVFLQTYAYHYEDYYKEWKALFDYKKMKNKGVLEQKRAAIDCL